jgi:hypothetical protein
VAWTTLGQAGAALVAGEPADPQHRPGQAFVDDVGFGLLFPTVGVALPSLYDAASQQPLPLSEMAWGPDEQRVWEWKDELPARGWPSPGGSCTAGGPCSSAPTCWPTAIPTRVRPTTSARHP